MLAEYGKEARILAGGTDLLPLMRDRALTPKYIIEITRVPGLDYIDVSNGQSGIKIGALVTLGSVELSEIIKNRFPLIPEAAHLMATRQVRNMATIAGNICRASPSADMVPPLLVLQAEIKIANNRGTRVVPCGEFFTGPGTTILNGSEMVTEIRIPELPLGCGTSFLRATRTQSDLAQVNAASVVMIKDGICEEVRIALGGVAPTAIRLRKAEEALKGKRIEGEALENAAELAAGEIRPISDVRATAEYRMELSKVLVKHVLETSVGRAERRQR